MAPRLLTDPMLQCPGPDSVHVVWFTDAPAPGRVVAGGHVVEARATRLTRMADDSGDALAPVEVWRHEALVRGLAPGQRLPYHVEVGGDEAQRSATFHLRPAPRDTPVQLMLASDHQLHPNATRAMELAHQTFGPVDGIVFAGDLANVPDRAADWFHSPGAFFRSLRGRADATGSDRRVSRGAPLLQETPLWPAIGNHEVQGRVGPDRGLTMSAVPRHVAAAHCPGCLVGPERERWIEDHSWSVRTVEELFRLPTNPSGHSRWYATTIGDVRLVTLFHTRQWRPADADANPSRRTRPSRFQESQRHLDEPLEQGHGCHVFQDLDPDGDQFRWLRDELASAERAACRYTIVQLHEGAHGWGGNVEPPFGTPERIEERDEAGQLVGIRYEYDRARNHLARTVMPLLEDAGVQLVYSGHSHVWNRFAHGGTQYLEASNTGRSHGIHDAANPRPVPPPPWRSECYTAVGNPYGVAPAAPPFGHSDVMTFTRFDSASGRLESWRARVDGAPECFDVVTLTPHG